MTPIRVKVPTLTDLPASPFEPDREIGTVIEVRSGLIGISLPRAMELPQRRYGHRVPAGQVGEYVLIDIGFAALFGQITSVRLPERGRYVSEVGREPAASGIPLGTVRPLSTVDLTTRTHLVGVRQYPRLADRVYSAHPGFVAWVVDLDGPSTQDEACLRLGHLSGEPSVSVRLSPEAVFGRHCAILGTTGAGKSWTAARIVEEARRIGIRTLLLDATGEYRRMSGPDVLDVSLGDDGDQSLAPRHVTLPYHCLHEMDLFALLRPGPGVQAPKLREAIRSLRLAAALGADHPLVEPGHGCLLKAGRARAPIEAAANTHATIIANPTAPFAFARLPEQIQHECIWPTARSEKGLYGDVNQQDLGYCTSLVMRVDSALSSPELSAVFGVARDPHLLNLFDSFLESDQHSSMRLSLARVPFTQNAREVTVNAIGRDLLRRARGAAFVGRPLLIVLDEAHNFFAQRLGEEEDRYALDAFELIAKEGRKYGLVLCLVTQRARDLPPGVMSQMGTFLLHRVANDRDRDILERSGSDLDRDALGALPLLTPGEMLGVGVAFPIPLRLEVDPPAAEPESDGPQFTCIPGGVE